MSSHQHESFDESILFNEGPTTLMERLGYVRQLVFSKTRLEFRLLWNKIFQKEDEELGWLLNPYRQAQRQGDATMMSSFNKSDPETSYQYGYDNVGSVLGRERVTIYNRGLTKKTDRSRRRRQDNKTMGDRALEYARYMGMGVYITSTSFPSPFLPVNDCNIYEENYYSHNSYAMSKVW